MTSHNELTLLDWEKSVQLADNDPDLAKDILILTCRSLPRDLQEITAAYKNHDEREMRRLLHKLEGGISYAKFPKLEQAIHELHTAVKSTETEQLETLYKNLEIAMLATVDAIEQKISNSSRAFP